MLNIDLHCHSNMSDGVLSPAEVVARAAANGVHALALTDHDDVAGIAAAQAVAATAGLRLIPGVEISVSWGGQTVHIVGLRIDPQHPELAAGLHGIRRGRVERARRMGDDLAQSGFAGAYAGACGYAANKQLVGRTHFARWLVAQGHVPDMRTAFRRFLTRGNPGYVEHEWTTLENAVGWIHASGGTAVIAHPGRYAFSARELHLLLDASARWAAKASKSSAAAITPPNTASLPTWRARSASRPRAERISMRRARAPISAACLRCRIIASRCGRAGRSWHPIFLLPWPEHQHLWRNSSIFMPTIRSPD